MANSRLRQGAKISFAFFECQRGRSHWMDTCVNPFQKSLWTDYVLHYPHHDGFIFRDAVWKHLQFVLIAAAARPQHWNIHAHRCGAIAMRRCGACAVPAESVTA